VLVLKKLQEANTQKDGTTPYSITKILSHNGFKKKTYQTPFAHSFHLLGPAKETWHWVVKFHLPMELLCFALFDDHLSN